MRKLATYIAPFFIVTALLSLTAAANDVDELHWLAGCWALDGQEYGSGENWMQPAGSSMIGISRVVANGKTVAFEYLRVIADEAGIALIASPSGQSTARFSLVLLSEVQVVFENPDHDFPQRITYKLEDADRLLASISGDINGVPRTEDFPMTRTACVNNSEAQ